MNYRQWQHWRAIEKWLHTPPKTVPYLNGQRYSPAINARIDEVLSEVAANGKSVIGNPPLPLWKCKRCGMETRMTISWPCPKNDDTQCEFEKAKRPSTVTPGRFEKGGATVNTS